MPEITDPVLAEKVERYKEEHKPEGPKRQRRIVIECEMRMDFGEPKMPKIVGYAAVFNQPTHLWGDFYEQVAPGAFRDVIESGDDIYALLNHDPSLAFASTRSQTLHLGEDEHGLKYEIYPIPEIDTAQRVKSLIRQGIIHKSSFGFNIEEERNEKRTEGKGTLRTILKVKPLFDVSPVTYPAYQQTDVYVRMFAGEKEIAYVYEDTGRLVVESVAEHLQVEEVRLSDDELFKRFEDMKEKVLKP